uniref:Kazal-like domain-containing protein n=1 Tax=Calidris pygmaea TaxID=425635 RepID=A0A8C3PMV0_9CHAR
MNGGGIENPVFEPPSPDLGRRRQASPAGVDAGVPAEAEAEEGPCGWGRCTPKALQLCNNPEGYLAAYSLLAIFQGIVVNGLINISISTIEKRYELNSSLTGLISASYDIAFCVLSLFVSFFGERGHKPRWLAFSAFMLGLGSLIFSLPHFSSGKYHYGAKLEASSANFTCNASTKSSLPNYLYVFILGQLLLGIGGTPLYTLGTAFIDDSVPTHKSSLYIGIGYAMSLLGPAIGYVLGGQLLTVYIDIQIPESTNMDQDDPRWLGAWWIAFVACFFAIWLLIIPFSCFPKHLPGNYGISTLHATTMNLIIASSSEALVATGFATFLPKFIENQFGKTSSFSAILGGLVLIPAAALGQIISGILISKCTMDCKSIIKFMIGTCSVALLLNTVFLYAKCGNEPFAGVSETYNGTGMLHNLTAPCNANCGCLRFMYYPVCGRDEIQYFSPCFAGCSSYLFNNKKAYHNCSCIGKPKRENGSEDFIYEAVAGKCPTQCKAHLLCNMILIKILCLVCASPILSSSLAWHFTICTIPGPILFGVAIDNSCALWDIDECKTKGACWVYDNERMAYLLMGISAACKIITIIFVVMAVYLYKPPPASAAMSQKDSEMVSSVHT